MRLARLHTSFGSPKVVTSATYCCSAQPVAVILNQVESVYADWQIVRWIQLSSRQNSRQNQVLATGGLYETNQQWLWPTLHTLAFTVSLPPKMVYHHYVTQLETIVYSTKKNSTKRANQQARTTEREPQKELFLDLESSASILFIFVIVLLGCLLSLISIPAVHSHFQSLKRALFYREHLTATRRQHSGWNPLCDRLAVCCEQNSQPLANNSWRFIMGRSF